MDKNKRFKCRYCGLEVSEIPEFKEGECRNTLQHEFKIYKKCSICDTFVRLTEENTCTECERTFCEEHNLIGGHWNGDSSKDEHLSGMCDHCAIDSISGQADNSMLENK